MPSGSSDDRGPLHLTYVLSLGLFNVVLKFYFGGSKTF